MSDAKNQFTISELNKKIRSSLELSFSDIWVSGEISNFHHHPSSQHMYFTMKDDTSELQCVMFRGLNQYLRFKPDEGLQVCAYGSISIYEYRGQIQLIISRLEPAGIGDLFKAYIQLKERLKGDGLFSDNFKKEIPKFPKRVGVVTSKSGAALKDILQVLNRRSPFINIILSYAQVQGEGSAKEICKSIHALDNWGKVDAIIVARGGGSIEDLWAFNEEILAYAVFDCKTPIISAVGHETDFTIIDFVADLRAPTPSAAAELVSISKEELYTSIDFFDDHLNSIIKNKLEQIISKIAFLKNKVELLMPQKRIKRQLEKLERLEKRLIYGFRVQFLQFNELIIALDKQLKGLGPQQVLKRGYSIAFSLDGEIVRKSSDVAIGQDILLQTGEGSFTAKKSLENKQNNMN